MKRIPSPAWLILAAIFGLLCSYAGWIYANATAATECERLVNPHPTEEST